jgi:hypothetical protein
VYFIIKVKEKVVINNLNKLSYHMVCMDVNVVFVRI